MPETANPASTLSPTRRQLLAGAAAAAAALPAARAAAQPAPAPGDGNGAGPDLSGKSVLVTGTSSGFGRLGAVHYARLGAQVFATMRNLPRPEAEALRQTASDEGLALSVIEIDVTDPEQVRRGVAQAEAEAGGALDVLINNAGISYSGPVEMQDMDATHHLFDTNVYGPHRMARAALPAMRERGQGLIVQVSSQLGRVVIPGFGQYSPTKFALEAMSDQMAMELAAHGVDVSVVQPGGYPTEIWANALALSEELVDRTPDALLDTYAAYLAQMEARGAAASQQTSDPMDIPRATAELIAAAPGTRPLRVPVHPGPKPQLGVNEASRKAQHAMLTAMGQAATANAVYGKG